MVTLPDAIVIAGFFIGVGLLFGLRLIAKALPESAGKISGALMTLSNKLGDKTR